MELETIRTIVFFILLGVMPLLSVTMLLTHTYYCIKYDVKTEIIVVVFSFMVILPALIILLGATSQVN